MAMKEHPIDVIQHFVPPNTAQDIIDWMHHYKIHLKIRKDRKSILGDYRPAHQGKPHTISINANLNTYHFLITFLHELAHLINYLNHGQKVLPHGHEWKSVFHLFLKKFYDRAVFPEDIRKALDLSMSNLSASTCSDPILYKVLRNYDAPSSGILIDELQLGDQFKTKEGRLFEVLSKRRTRYECVEVSTKRKYLFPSIYEVYKEY